jgi:hypothetical protein
MGKLFVAEQNGSVSELTQEVFRRDGSSLPVLHVALLPTVAVV